MNKTNLSISLSYSRYSFIPQEDPNYKDKLLDDGKRLQLVNKELFDETSFIYRIAINGMSKFCS